MDSLELSTYVLLLFGGTFLFINLHILVQFLRYRRLRSSAVLVWRGPAPPFYNTFILMAIALVLVIVVKLIFLHWPPKRVFGESMMLLYFSLLGPLSVRITRGFYENGVWLDNGFVSYDSIGGLSWREPEPITLLLVPRLKGRAYSLVVPTQYYGQARKLLREKIKDREINMTGRALDLGAHDERDDV